MIKTLALVGLVLLLAVGALVVYASTKPDVFRIERSVTIAAAPEKIHPLINDMQRFNTWNPFNKKDPAMKTRYHGPAAGPGAAYDFDGDSNVGKGSIRIVEPPAADAVAMQLDMLAPMKASNQIVFRLQPEGAGGTRVTWSMQGTTPLVGKVLHTVFDMDKMIGKDFDTGLADLKALAERA